MCLFYIMCYVNIFNIFLGFVAKFADRSPNTVATKVLQTSSITPMPAGKLSTTTVMKLISTDTSPATVTNRTPLNIRKASSSTSANTQTSLSTDLTETVTHGSTGMRQRKLLCKCPKRLINTKWHNLDGMNITDAQVKKIVLEDFNKNIKSEISVDKKTVSKELRKKNSSVNKRKPSQSIGRGSIVFLIFPIVFLIGIDILNCCIHFRTRLDDRRRNCIRPTTNTQDQRERPKPLKENSYDTESYYASNPDEMKRETHQRKRVDNYHMYPQNRDEWLQYI